MSLYTFLKSYFDFVTAILILLLTIPLNILIIVCILIFEGKPIFFKQKRAGHKGMPFLIYKYRSMNYKCGADGKLLPDKMRLTPIGKFLRSTSLDELPNLINVIQGKMSIVGPRPLPMKYNNLFQCGKYQDNFINQESLDWLRLKGEIYLAGKKDWNLMLCILKKYHFF